MRCLSRHETGSVLINQIRQKAVDLLRRITSQETESASDTDSSAPAHLRIASGQIICGQKCESIYFILAGLAIHHLAFVSKASAGGYFRCSDAASVETSYFIQRTGLGINLSYCKCAGQVHGFSCSTDDTSDVIGYGYNADICPNSPDCSFGVTCQSAHTAKAALDASNCIGICQTSIVGHVSDKSAYTKNIASCRCFNFHIRCIAGVHLGIGQVSEKTAHSQLIGSSLRLRGTDIHTRNGAIGYFAVFQGTCQCSCRCRRIRHHHIFHLYMVKFCFRSRSYQTHANVDSGHFLKGYSVNLQVGNR